jgi:hypothetical protein
VPVSCKRIWWTNSTSMLVPFFDAGPVLLGEGVPRMPDKFPQRDFQVNRVRVLREWIGRAALMGHKLSAGSPPSFPNDQ